MGLSFGLAIGLETIGGKRLPAKGCPLPPRPTILGKGWGTWGTLSGARSQTRFRFVPCRQLSQTKGSYPGKRPLSLEGSKWENFATV
jgi:hypothetical protein